VLDRVSESHEASEGVAEQRVALQAELLGEARHRGCMAGQVPCRAVTVVRAPVPREVGRDHAVGRGEALEPGEEDAAVEAGPRMEEEDRVSAARLAVVDARG